MGYTVEIKPRAIKDLRKIDRAHATKIADALGLLEESFQGDIKKLSNRTPEYRLRVGQYRVLFEVVGADRLIIYRILHRREAYR